MEKTCFNANCGAVFVPYRVTQKFCSRRCKTAFFNAARTVVPGQRAADGRSYRERNKEAILARYVAGREADPDRQRKRCRLSDARRRAALRQSVIAAMGGRCVRCGFTDWRALQVDHINGGGHQDRQATKRHSYWKKVLVSHEGVFQLLCANCNQIKRYEQGEGVGTRKVQTKHQRKY